MKFVRSPPDNFVRLKQISSPTKTKCSTEAHQLLKLYRNLCRGDDDNAFSTCYIMLLFSVTLDNVVCMTACKEIITGLMWLVMCIYPREAVTVVPNQTPHLCTSSAYNSPPQRDL